jgi:hypothetical protein
MTPTKLNPLTRAAQVAAYDAPSQPIAVASSCIGHSPARAPDSLAPNWNTF